MLEKQLLLRKHLGQRISSSPKVLSRLKSLKHVSVHCLQEVGVLVMLLTVTAPLPILSALALLVRKRMLTVLRLALTGEPRKMTPGYLRPLGMQHIGVTPISLAYRLAMMEQLLISPLPTLLATVTTLGPSVATCLTSLVPRLLNLRRRRLDSRMIWMPEASPLDRIRQQSLMKSRRPVTRAKTFYRVVSSIVSFNMNRRTFRMTPPKGLKWVPWGVQREVTDHSLRSAPECTVLCSSVWTEQVPSVPSLVTLTAHVQAVLASLVPQVATRWRKQLVKSLVLLTWYRLKKLTNRRLLPQQMAL